MPGKKEKLSPGAIFDLDATILDTVRDLMNSMNRALSALGYEGHDLAAYKAMVGNGNLKLAERALPPEARDEETVRKTYLAFKKDYAEHLMDFTEPYPGIPGLLRELKGMGWPLAVLSNKDHEGAAKIVSHFFPGIFDAALGVALPQRPPKPDPKGALEILALIKREPGAVYYFGDSEVDMSLASSLGCVAVGVSWGFRPRRSVSDAGAEIMLDHPDEFLPSIELRHA